jgi:type IV pilus assembly protein PilB
MTTATKQRPRLGDLLVCRGLITAEQLASALDVQSRGEQARLLGEILVDLGYASPEQVLSAVAEACSVPFARLTPQLVDPAVRSALPEAFIQAHGVLPLFRVRGVLTVASSEPSNLFLGDEIAHASGLSVQIVAATPENIYQMLDETRASDPAAPSLAEEPAADAPASAELLLSDDYDSVYGTWPPEKVASLLVREAVAARASAIHLEPDEKVLRIRFRIDGRLHVVMRPPVRLAAGLAGAFDGILGLTGAAAPDVRRSARLLVQGRAVQLHVASLPSAFGLRTVVRIVRDDSAQKPLEKLGCDFELLTAYRGLLADLRGLILIAGPRESGATTTLYSTLNAVDPIRLNICTLESCINFNLPGVNQFSPATCGTADAASILGRVLLQQPDVLALDGVLDAPVAERAVQAALDGRLVLAQVRAADAADALATVAAATRHPEAVAMALRGVLAQRVVRTVCLHCRGAGEPPAGLRRRLAEAFGPIEQYVKGRGCVSCGRTGYSGQIGLFELVTMAPDLVPLVQARADRDTLRTAIRAAGHPSLWVDGINKVRAGITSIEEVLEVLAGCPGGPSAVEQTAARR